MENYSIVKYEDIYNLHPDRTFMFDVYKSYRVGEREHREHCGYEFYSLEDAEAWAQTGVFPVRYIKINWELFPDNESFIKVEAESGDK